jgi:hypothetical protein
MTEAVFATTFRKLTKADTEAETVTKKARFATIDVALKTLAETRFSTERMNVKDDAAEAEMFFDAAFIIEAEVSAPIETSRVPAFVIETPPTTAAAIVTRKLLRA